MKKRIVFLSAIIISIFLLNACTKSENDKIVGVWKLTNSERKLIQTGTTTTVYINVFNGTILTSTQDGSIKTYSYSKTLTIKEDGTYKLESLKDGKIDSREDIWYWINSYDKNASFCINSTDYKIKELTKEKLILERNYVNNDYNKESLSETETYVK